MVTAWSQGEPGHDGLISVTLEQMKEELELAQPPPLQQSQNKDRLRHCCLFSSRRTSDLSNILAEEGLSWIDIGWRVRYLLLM